MGLQTQLIDDYSTTTQSVTATASSTNTASASASEAIGGSRDIQVTNSAGTGQLTLFVDSASDTLSVGALGDGSGTALIQYDGAEATAVLDPVGLGGVAFAGGAPGDPLDPGAGLIVETRAQDAGDSLFITIYTDGSRSSTATVTINADPTNFTETFVRFSDFVGNADFNDVGAVETSVTVGVNNDVNVSIVETRRPEVVQSQSRQHPTHCAWRTTLLGQFGGGSKRWDSARDRSGLTGVTVELYQLAGPDDVVDPTGVPLTSTTTGAGGTYNFPGLDPGNYAVVIPASQFQTGAALFGFANSTGNDPAPDPDDNVDNDDNGTTVAGGAVVSGTITLVSNDEPIDDDDTNPNTNTTVDFGFFPQIDLVITKSLNAASSNIIAGGNAVFDIVVKTLAP